jgi:hypothetical protein
MTLTHIYLNLHFSGLTQAFHEKVAGLSEIADRRQEYVFCYKNETYISLFTFDSLFPRDSLVK